MAIDDFLTENYFEGVEDMNDLNYNETVMMDNNVNDDINGEGSDWIELSGCGKHSKWKFPSCLTKCPVLTCSAEFSSRSDVINHFKEKHSADLILCYLW